jgi:hypothetical protein
MLHGSGLWGDQLTLFADFSEIQDDAFIAALKIAGTDKPEFVILVAQTLLKHNAIDRVSERVRKTLAELLEEIARRPRQLTLFDVDTLEGDEAPPRRTE